MQPTFEKNPYPISWIQGNGKKPSHAIVPLKGWLVYVDSLSNSLFAHRNQGITKRCHLSWLTNSALICEPKCGGGGSRGLSHWVQLCTWSPKKLWRSNSIFSLFRKLKLHCHNYTKPFFSTHPAHKLRALIHTQSLIMLLWVLSLTASQCFGLCLP